MRLTLRHRLVMLMAAAIVPLLGLFMINAVLSQKDAVSRASEALAFAASLVAANQDRVVDSARQMLVSVAHSPGLMAGEAAHCQRYFKTVKAQFPVYADIGIIGLDGHFLCRSTDNARGVFVGDRDYFLAALKQRGFVGGGYVQSRVSGKSVVLFALPINDAQGQASAVAFVSIDLGEMAKAVSQAAQGRQVTILDRQGLVLVANPPDAAVIGRPAPSALLQAAAKSLRSGVGEELDALGRERIYAFLPASQAPDAAFFVAVSVDRDGVLASSRQQFKLQLAALALVVFLAGALAWIISGRIIVAPALALVEAVRQVRKGRLEVRIPVRGEDEGNEFSSIAAGFNLMTESLQQQRDALQAELARSWAVQEKLRDAQRVGCIGYWQIDLDTRQLWCSDEFYELIGLERVGAVWSTDGFIELIHPADRDAFKAASQAAMAAAMPLDLEFRIITPAGALRWMHQFGRVHGHHHGELGARRAGVIQDITQRKLAEQALIDSEQRYAALFESAPVPMWVYETDTTRFLTVNRAATEAYGYSAQEFLSMTAFDIRPEAEHGRLRHLLEGMPTYKRGWQHRRKDGSLLTVNVISRGIRYGGRPARFVVALDMSAQVKAEAQVQDYLFTLQRAADAAHAITWHQTLEGTLQEIVDQARGVIGAHQAVVSFSQGSDPAQIIHAISLSKKYAAWQDFTGVPDDCALYALACGKLRGMRLTQAELQAHPCWQHFDAQQPALRGWLAVPLLGRAGENIGLLQLSDKYQDDFTQQDEYVAIELARLAAAAIDNARLLEQVSQLNAGLEQKVAERTAELSRQEALFRALAEQAPQTVWMASPEGAATYYNRAWFDLMGGDFQDWAGYQWLGAVHPEDVAGLKANWKTARVSLQPYSGIRRLRGQDGCFHTMAYRASAVLDAQGQVAFWVGIDADITELKAIEAALRLSNQELEAFSYSVSHDLRAPLNTIDGFSRLLAKRLGEAADEKVQHYLARIQAGVAQMGQLIEDLLALSQLTRAQLRSETLDLTNKASSILAELQLRQPQRQVAVSVQAGLRAEGDGRLLRVALENLLTNAWKFTAQQDSAQISVGQLFDAAGQPVFFVRDNGAGFDMAYADKLFVPFQRLHAASEFPGTGIGLAIVSRVIERHGGRLWAESAPGCGATFFFTLPRLGRAA